MGALEGRNIRFGIQTRIDIWTEKDIAWLGRAGCVSIEAGVESISAAGRSYFNKETRLPAEILESRLIYAKAHVPFVQATLLGCPHDPPESVSEWRRLMLEKGIWANLPVPLFPYPGSREYRSRWGEPDDTAWERAHRHYLSENLKFSDIQESRPLPIEILEKGEAHAK